MKIKTVFDQMDGSESVPELTLNFRRSLIDKKPLRATEDHVEFFRSVFDPGLFEVQEEMILLILDTRNRPVCFYRFAKGAANSIDIDYRILFQVLLSVGADKFIMAHNHPDKIALASQADIEATHAIAIRSRMFGIEFLDHIILGSLEEPEEEPGYFSIAENDLFFE